MAPPRAHASSFILVGKAGGSECNSPFVIGYLCDVIRYWAEEFDSWVTQHTGYGKTNRQHL
jgi:hypothetical protein